MTEPILSRTFPNGLVLVAEPMTSLQSAAFTFLRPGRLRLRSAEPRRAGQLRLRDDRCAGRAERDSRQFILDLDNLGVERSEVGLRRPRQLQRGHAGRESAAPRWRSMPTCSAGRTCRPTAGAGRQVVLQELRAVEDEPAEKVMIELRRAALSRALGPAAQGEQEAWRRPRRTRSALFSGSVIAQRHDPRRRRPDRLGAAEGPGRPLLGDWQPRAEPRRSWKSRPRGEYLHIAYESNQTQIGIAYDSVPYRHPDYFQAWGAVGVLSGGMSSRLFTEVRERRGLCYSVYATYHTLRDRGGRALLCRHHAPSGPRKRST